jgi:hypothetical protein
MSALRVSIASMLLASCASSGARPPDGAVDGSGDRGDVGAPAVDLGAPPADASRGIDAGPTEGACWMVRPAAACGDGVCDPGCENALDCPGDCPAPSGGIACSGGPTTWSCNANASARYVCAAGHYVIETCGGPGSCQTQPGAWPAQCHGCNPCDTFYMGLGTPYLWTCTPGRPTQRRRCIDQATGGDCIQGASATCCAVDDDCTGGNCLSRPEGTDDLCP